MFCTTFRPLATLPTWTRTPTSTATDEQVRISAHGREWLVERSWIDAFVPDDRLGPRLRDAHSELDRYDWSQHLPSREAGCTFFDLLRLFDEHEVTPLAVLVAERLGLDPYARLYWEHITGEQLRGLSAQHAVELASYPNAMSHMCVISDYLTDHIGNPEALRVFPRAVLEAFFNQAWVPYRHVRPWLHVNYRFPFYSWCDDVHFVIAHGALHACVGELVRPVPTPMALYSRDDPPPIAVRLVDHYPAAHVMQHPEVRDKTVYLSPHDRLVFEDTFYIFGERIVFDDKDLPVKDNVAITATGRLVVRAGHHIHVSDECARVRFGLFYDMRFRWRTIDLDAEILDAGTFRTDFVDEYITVALERHHCVYRISAGEDPVAVLTVSADRIVTSFEVYDEPYYRCEDEDDERDPSQYGTPYFPDCNHVYFTDGRETHVFQPPGALLRVAGHVVVPRIVDFGLDRHTRRLGAGFYGMRTPDLPRPAGGGFQFYYRLVNYAAQYCGGTATTRCSDYHVDVTSHAAMTRVELL